MNWTKEITIWCDATDRQGPCVEWITSLASSVDEARQDARSFSWSYVDGLDLCPSHQPRGQ